MSNAGFSSSPPSPFLTAVEEARNSPLIVGVRPAARWKRLASFIALSCVLIIAAGIIIVFVIFGVVSASLEYETWSAIAGSTIWMKFIFDYILSRQAHPIIGKKRGRQDKPTGEAGE